jgi:hypothetical protein
MASNVETILGHLGRIMGHYRWSLRHGFSHRPLCFPNVRISRQSLEVADCVVPISLVFCPS